MKLFDKGVLMLAAPVFAGHLLSFLYGAADTVFISMLNRQSTDLVTGVGLTIPLNLLALAVGSGLMAGSASLVSRALGAKDECAVERAGRAALGLGAICAVAMGVGFFVGADALIALFAGPSVGGAVRAAAKAYLLGAAPGYAILAFELALLGLLMGEGKTVVYGVAMTLGTVLNLLLDPLFMFAFGWGVWGAAIATSAATLLSAVFILYSVAKEADRFGFGKKRRENDGSMKNVNAAVEIVRVGLPQALSLLVVSLSFMFLNRVIGVFGPVRLNAWIVVGRIEECVLMIGYAIGSACMIMSGTFWGAGNKKELEEAIGRCLKTALAVCAVVVVPYMLAAPLIFRAFSGNSSVVDACAAQVRSISWSTAGVVVSLVAVSGLQGMGKAFSSFALILIRLGLFLILPVALLTAAEMLTFPLFLAIFAASSVAGGVVSALSLIRNAETLTEQAESAVLSVSE
ncbi:MAG: MATE family efflux transporter [Treponemataceae bacterium]